MISNNITNMSGSGGRWKGFLEWVCQCSAGSGARFPDKYHHMETCDSHRSLWSVWIWWWSFTVYFQALLVLPELLGWRSLCEQSSENCSNILPSITQCLWHECRLNHKHVKLQLLIYVVLIIIECCGWKGSIRIITSTPCPAQGLPKFKSYFWESPPAPEPG